MVGILEVVVRPLVSQRLEAYFMADTVGEVLDLPPVGVGPLT